MQLCKNPLNKVQPSQQYIYFNTLFYLFDTTVYSDCEVELCINGGTCKKLGSSYICECVDDYTGLDCEIGQLIATLLATIIAIAKSVPYDNLFFDECRYEICGLSMNRTFYG